MSADNWTVCPRCRDRAKAEKLARAQAAVDAYGKVSAEEYAALVERSTEPLEPKETFREDYEFYGEVSVLCRSRDRLRGGEAA